MSAGESLESTVMQIMVLTSNTMQQHFDFLLTSSSENATLEIWAAMRAAEESGTRVQKKLTAI
jgi:hypothetical protein